MSDQQKQFERAVKAAGDDVASAVAKRAERARQKGITEVYDRLHKGKLGAHWLWCVIERIGLGHDEAEVMQEYGYYEPRE